MEKHGQETKKSIVGYVYVLSRAKLLKIICFFSVITSFYSISLMECRHLVGTRQASHDGKIQIFGGNEARFKG